MECDILVIGAGPAGLTAGIYGARANLVTYIIAGLQTSSQLITTEDVENYPGFTDITGPQLLENMNAQATKYGANICYCDVTSVDFSKRPFKITTNDESTSCFYAKTVIIATGSESRRLKDVPNEEKYWNQRLISTCAVCDSYIANKKPTVVVGGGDSACTEALYLSNISPTVYLVHRRREFRASAIMVDRVKSKPNIEIVYDSVVESINGTDNSIDEVVVKDVKTNAVRSLPVHSLFWAVGHDVRNELFKNQGIEMDSEGYIKHIDRLTTATSVPGVFSAGDVSDKKYRQACVAAGDGARAAIDCEHFIQLN